MFIWNMVNLGKVEIWGVDANINTTFQLAKHYSLLLTGNYTYQYAVDKIRGFCQSHQCSPWMSDYAVLFVYAGGRRISGQSG